jgi:hypothetical protein
MKFGLQLRVGGHCGEFGVPGVVTARHRRADAMHETFQQAELSFGR